MSVICRGNYDYSNAKLKDFSDNKIYLTMFCKFRNYKDTFSLIRAVFRSNGLLGEIRTTCYGDTLAVDVSSEWGESRCLTTECKSVQEAKNILLTWFKSKGFSKKSLKNWREYHLGYNPPKQLSMFKTIYNL